MPDAAQSTAAPCSSDKPGPMSAPQAHTQQGLLDSSAGDAKPVACRVAPGGSVSSSSSSCCDAALAVAPATSFVPAATASYLQADYWDARFAAEDSYEWCKVSTAAVRLHADLKTTC